MVIRNITVEEFFMKAGIPNYSEKDIDAVQEYINEIDLDNYMFEFIPQRVVRTYADLLMRGEPLGYGELLEKVNTELLEANEDAELICIGLVRDAREETLVIDRTLKRVYFNRHGFIINDVARAEKVIELTDELWNQCLEILREMKIEQAKPNYDGDTQYRSYTVVAVKYHDEGIKRVESIGISSGMPEEIADGVIRLMRLFA